MLSYVKRNVTVEPINVLLHESRPSGSWLIFDVGQSFGGARAMTLDGEKEEPVVAQQATRAQLFWRTGSLPGILVPEAVLRDLERFASIERE